MKDIFDPRFKYRPSFDTDVRKTFERIRREQKERAEKAAKVVATIQPKERKNA